MRLVRGPLNEPEIRSESRGFEPVDTGAQLTLKYHRCGPVRDRYTGVSSPRWGFDGGRKRDREHRDKGPKDRPILWTPKLADARHVRRFAPTRRQATRYAGQRPSSSEKDELSSQTSTSRRGFCLLACAPRRIGPDRLISNETHQLITQRDLPKRFGISDVWLS